MLKLLPAIDQHMPPKIYSMLSEKVTYLIKWINIESCSEVSTSNKDIIDLLKNFSLSLVLHARNVSHVFF